MSFIIATHTASFRAAEFSEDRLAVHHVAGGIVVIVADGAGGQPGGGSAADLAIRLVGEALTPPRFNAFTPRSRGDLLVAADVLIEHDRAAGETTCVVVAIADDGRELRGLRRADRPARRDG
ncbi:MAG TPA: protein phosphatase 2C domain-containing protein [Polyangiaceae bacterium]